MVSTESRREPSPLRSFSQCTAIRIFHENILDRNEDPRVTSETTIARRYYDEIVNSSIFENACLPGTYKDIFFLLHKRQLRIPFLFYIFKEFYDT